MHLSDPVVLAALVGGGGCAADPDPADHGGARRGAIGANGRTAGQQMQMLGGQVQQLGTEQEQLRGGLQTVSDTQANAQAQMIQTVEARLARCSSRCRTGWPTMRRNQRGR